MSEVEEEVEYLFLPSLLNVGLLLALWKELCLHPSNRSAARDTQDCNCCWGRDMRGTPLFIIITAAPEQALDLSCPVLSPLVQSRGGMPSRPVLQLPVLGSKLDSIKSKRQSRGKGEKKGEQGEESGEHG